MIIVPDPSVLLADIGQIAACTDRVWHVRKDGNDSRSGRTPREAKLTLAALLGMDGFGDVLETIHLGRGIWNEQVILGTKQVRLVGAGIGATTISQVFDTGDPDDCRTLTSTAAYLMLENLCIKVNGAAIMGGDQDASGALFHRPGNQFSICRLRNIAVLCGFTPFTSAVGGVGAWLEGTSSGGFLAPYEPSLIDIDGCYFSGQEHGLNIMAHWGNIRNSQFRSRDYKNCNSNALVISGLEEESCFVVDRCTVSGIGAQTPASGQFFANGLGVLLGQVLVTNCSIAAKAMTQETNAAAVLADPNVCMPLVPRIGLVNCMMRSAVTPGGGVEGTAFDILNGSEDVPLYIEKCAYDPSKTAGLLLPMTSPPEP